MNKNGGTEDDKDLGDNKNCEDCEELAGVYCDHFFSCVFWDEKRMGTLVEFNYFGVVVDEVFEVFHS